MRFPWQSASRQSPAAPVQVLAPAPREVRRDAAERFVLDLFDGGFAVCVFARGVRPGETSGFPSFGEPDHAHGFPDLRRAARAGRALSLRGNFLPSRLSPHDVTQAQEVALRTIYGALKSASKELARDSGSSERSARNHLSGAHAFSLTDFFNACRSNVDVREWGCAMMGCDSEESLQKRLDEIEAIIVASRFPMNGGR